MKEATGITWLESFVLAVCLVLSLIARREAISRVSGAIAWAKAIGQKGSAAPVQLSPECVEESRLSEEHTRRYEVWCGGSNMKSSKGGLSRTIGSWGKVKALPKTLMLKTKLFAKELYFSGDLAILGALLTVAVPLVFSESGMMGLLLGLGLSIPIMVLLLPKRGAGGGLLKK